jgi:hypothetical protein
MENLKFVLLSSGLGLLLAILLKTIFNKRGKLYRLCFRKADEYEGILSNKVSSREGLAKIDYYRFDPDYADCEFWLEEIK